MQCSAMWFSAKVGSAARRGATMQNSKIGAQHNMQRGAPCNLGSEMTAFVFVHFWNGEDEDDKGEYHREKQEFGG